MLPAGKSWLLFGVLLCTKSSAGSTAQSKGGKNAHPEVITAFGRLQGKITSVKGTDQPVNVFLGVPFAKPPIGSLRFAPPQPPEPWSHVRNSTSFPPVCLQDLQWYENIKKSTNIMLPKITMSEDCLYLNVFTPDTKGNFPVMVWIHGGGLEIGGSFLYEASPLSAYEGVVVVVIQYRLGILGFFSTGSADAPGNWGLLDQTEALRWVQKNIRSFGGDPQSVTIFGESSGGYSVGAHMLSPLSQGLFHRAVSQSGVVLFPDMTFQAEAPAKEIANVSGCGTNSAELVCCLRNKTEQELIPMMKEVTSTYPVVDGKFFPKAPKELLAAKEFNLVPYLLGVNNHEYGWLIFQILNFPNISNGISRENATTGFQLVATMLGLSPESTQKVLDKYLGDTEDRIKIRDRFQDMMGDAIFVVPAVEMARIYRDFGAPVYFYEFQHQPIQHRGTRPDFVKADHGDEIAFVFGLPFLKGTSPIPSSGDEAEGEKQLSKTIMKYWANFARTGNPNSNGLVEWPRYEQNEGYLELNLRQRSAEKLKKKQVDFWMGILHGNTKTEQEKETHADL
uniref:fatty acyl-CoA hydrolase precursor, medium chain-like n=1 Tax=Euleptes europaea TaxID=460621 RepID=UPI00253F8643|nr:fatty acyl-CoA hydrolase precursor, medium chain-like [Euleptes europaea]